VKNLNKKDKKNREIVCNLETKKFILKFIFFSSHFSKFTRWNAGIKISDLPKKSSKTVLVNRCVYTNRKKRINKLFSFSRIKFRQLARDGSVYGLKKSSW